MNDPLRYNTINSYSDRRIKMPYRRNLGILFAIVGIVLVIFAAVSIVISYNSSIHRESVIDDGVAVEGTVTSDWSEVHVHKSKSEGTYNNTTTYYGAVQYVYGGNTYTNPKVSFGSEHIISGKTVTMYIDTNDPSISYYSKEATQPFLSIIGLLVIGAAGVAVIVFAVKLLTGKKIKGISDNDPYLGRQSAPQAKPTRTAPAYDPNIPYSSNDPYSQDSYYPQNDYPQTDDFSLGSYYPPDDGFRN